MRRAAYRRNLDKNRDSVYEQSIRRRFGMSLDAYNDVLAHQGGVCALCGHPEKGSNRDGSQRRLHIDHDHSTGRIRSLLCSGCNAGLGGFKEDPHRMGEAIRYLKRHASEVR